MKIDISDELTLENGRGNPFGWSVQDIYHLGAKIGELYCGEPKIEAPGYSFTVTRETKNRSRLRVFFDDKNGELETLRDAQKFRAPAGGGRGE